MISIRPTLSLALAALALSCGGSPGPEAQPRPQPDPHPTPNQVELAIASVTLADDCGTAPTTVPAAPAAAVRSMPTPAGGASLSRMEVERPCEQSSIQLRVANGTTVASTITIRKIELLDDSGAIVGELAPRAPSRWTDDAYQPWDEQLAPNQVLQVSYALSAPAVSRGASYTVRVTIVAGDGERTLEQRTTREQRTTLEAPASLPPDMVT